MCRFLYFSQSTFYLSCNYAVNVCFERWLNTVPAIVRCCHPLYCRCFIPASGQQHLSVHLDRRLSTELSAGEVGVVRRVDIVVTQRLIHVLEDVETVKQHWSVVIWHQISTETVDWQPLCKPILAVFFSSLCYSSSCYSFLFTVFNLILWLRFIFIHKLYFITFII